MNPLLRSTIVYACVITCAVLGIQRLEGCIESGRRARVRIAELKIQIAARRADIARRQEALEQMQRARRALAKADLASIAPAGDAFAWARAEVRSHASGSGVEFVSISESSDKPVPVLKGTEGPWCAPFRLSMEMKGTEEAAIRFLRSTEQAGTYVQLHHFSVLASRDGRSAEVFATIEWPMWISNDKAEQIRAWREQAVAP